MELRDFLKLLGKHAKASLLLALLLGLTTYFVSYRLPVKYKATGSLYVVRQSEEVGAQYFSYEGFYAIQTAERYTDTVVGLLKSVDVKRDALVAVNGVFSTSALQKLDRSLIVKKVSPQLVTFSVASKEKVYAESLWKSLADATINKGKQLNSLGDSRLSIVASTPSYVITESKPMPYLYSAVAFLGGIFFVVFVLSFKEYLKG